MTKKQKKEQNKKDIDILEESIAQFEHGEAALRMAELEVMAKKASIKSSCKKKAKVVNNMCPCCGKGKLITTDSKVKRFPKTHMFKFDCGYAFLYNKETGKVFNDVDWACKNSTIVKCNKLSKEFANRMLEKKTIKKKKVSQETKCITFSDVQQEIVKAFHTPFNTLIQAPDFVYSDNCKKCIRMIANMCKTKDVFNNFNYHVLISNFIDKVMSISLSLEISSGCQGLPYELMRRRQLKKNNILQIAEDIEKELCKIYEK